MEELKNILKETFNKNPINFRMDFYQKNLMISFNCSIYIKKQIYDLLILHSNNRTVDLGNILIDLSYLEQAYKSNKFTKCKKVMFFIYIKNLRLFLDEFNIDYNNISISDIYSYKNQILSLIERNKEFIKIIDNNMKDMHVEFH